MTGNLACRSASLIRSMLVALVAAVFWPLQALRAQDPPPIIYINEAQLLSEPQRELGGYLRAEFEQLGAQFTDEVIADVVELQPTQVLFQFGLAVTEVGGGLYDVALGYTVCLHSPKDGRTHCSPPFVSLMVRNENDLEDTARSTADLLQELLKHLYGR